MGGRRGSLDGFSWPGSEKPQWRKLLPLQASVTAAREGAALHLDPIDLRVSQSDVGGSLVFDPSPEPLAVRGRLHSHELDINQFSTTSEESLTGAAEELDQPSGDVIGDAPLDWSWLSALQGQLQFTVDNLNFNQTHFQDVQLDLHIEDGALSIDPLQANLGAGGIRGNAHVARADGGAAVQARLIVTQLNPADLGRKNAGLIDGGYTDLLANFTTEGASPQALASHLNGEFALEVQRATVRNRLFEVIGSDILMQLVDLINPFAQREETTELKCAAAYFKAADGVLTSPGQLAVETGKMQIRGGGEIDLRDETLKIDFVPTARRGVGIGLGKLASVVRLGGTLGAPRPEADPGGIFKAGATIGAAIASGGISLLGQGLFDRVRSAGTRCGHIFEDLPQTAIPGAIEVPPAAQGDSPPPEN